MNLDAYHRSDAMRAKRWAVRILMALSLFSACLLLLCGCKEPAVEKPLKLPEDIRSRRKNVPKPKRTAVPAPADAPLKNDSSTNTREGATSKTMSTPAVLFPTPRVVEPITIYAKDMTADNGQEDGNGGWILWSNGATQIDNVKINFPAREIGLEVKGDPALSIWPEVDLNMYNRTTKTNYYPWGIRQYVTTSTYELLTKTINPSMMPGEYLITFRYYNNAVGGEIKADRNAYLRKIVIKP